MTARIVRLLAMVGVLVFLVAYNEEPAFAASYCCLDCGSMEDDYVSQCPGGAEQSEECADLAYWSDRCFNFCNNDLCEPPHPEVCHFWENGAFSWWVCH